MPRRRTPKTHIEMAEAMTSRWQSFPNIGGRPGRSASTTSSVRRSAFST